MILWKKNIFKNAAWDQYFRVRVANFEPLYMCFRVIFFQRAFRMALKGFLFNIKGFLQHAKESRGVLRQASKQAGKQAQERA